MKPPIVFHFGWAAVAICTFAAGYLAASSTVSLPNGGGSVEGKSSAASADLTSRPPMAASGGSDLANPTAFKTLSPNDARERGFRVVMGPATRVVRMRQLCDLLESISPENWRQVLDGFETALRSRGEEGGEAYNLLLEQIGAIGGAEAMQDALSPEKV